MVLRNSSFTHGAGSGRVTIFGRSFVRFEEEKETGGGGGGQTPAATTTETSGGKPPEKTYTAAEVAAIVQDRLEREKRKTPEPGKKPTSKAEPNNSDASWVFDLQDAIDAQTEERAVKVPQGLKKRMRASFAAERPDDPNAWVGSWLDDAGLVKKPPESTTTTNEKAAESKATTTQTTSQKSVSDKGTAAVTTRDVDAIENPMDYTQVDIERLYEKHGEDKANELITKKVMDWFKNVKIVPDRGGPRR